MAGILKIVNFYITETQVSFAMHFQVAITISSLIMSSSTAFLNLLTILIQFGLIPGH